MNPQLGGDREVRVETRQRSYGLSGEAGTVQAHGAVDHPARCGFLDADVLHLLRLGSNMRGGFGDQVVDWLGNGARRVEVRRHLADELTARLSPGPVVVVAPARSAGDPAAGARWLAHLGRSRRVGLVVYGGVDRGAAATYRLRHALTAHGVEIASTGLGFNTALHRDAGFTPFDDLARTALIDELIP